MNNGMEREGGRRVIKFVCIIYRFSLISASSAVVSASFATLAAVVSATSAVVSDREIFSMALASSSNSDALL